MTGFVLAAPLRVRIVKDGVSSIDEAGFVKQDYWNVSDVATLAERHLVSGP